jgi:hypothetical protein
MPRLPPGGSYGKVKVPSRLGGEERLGEGSAALTSTRTLPCRGGGQGIDAQAGTTPILVSHLVGREAGGKGTT